MFNFLIIYIMEGLNFVGAGLIVIGAGLGIGRIGGSAMDAVLVNQLRKIKQCLSQLHY
jgi:F0F1-type ATP synthase membrane subunit c/vacuolar-type H+-ATPase subunit K